MPVPSRSLRANRCAAPGRPQSAAATSAACAASPRSAARDRPRSGAAVEHALHEAPHLHLARESRAAAGRGRGGATGGGSSPTELSISTSPATRGVAVLRDVGQAIQHAERPADQHHGLVAEPGDQLGDVLPAAEMVVAGGRDLASPWPRGSRATTWYWVAKSRICGWKIQAGMVQPGTNTIVFGCVTPSSMTCSRTPSLVVNSASRAHAAAGSSSSHERVEASPRASLLMACTSRAVSTYRGASAR